MVCLLSIVSFTIMKNKYEKPIAVFHRYGGITRTSEAIKAGIHPRTLYEMLAKGIIVKLSRGLYRLADLPALGNPDLISVSKRIPDGVICLISALTFHKITAQIPHMIHVAVSRNMQVPTIDYPPVKTFRFSGNAYSEGIEKQTIDNMKVCIYSPAKTIADCFKYRNKIGLDVVIDALKRFKKNKKFNINEVLHFARICRVEKVIRPYLEALL